MPIRSVMIGDCSFYNSEFIFGVSQGMAFIGAWHSQVDIRCDISIIAKRAHEIRPHVIWGHCLLWSAGGPKHSADLLQLCSDLRKKYGTRVLIHDGDARSETRWPHDVSAAVDLALCNHTADRSAWKIPQLRWPYGAFTQRQIAAPVPEFRCRLAFAGRLGGGIYQERTALVERCRDWFGPDFRVFPTPEVPHTLFRTPELAASAHAVLGFGRPEAPGWTDVRVFQYPGAGGVLLHDDVQGFLEPWVHYVPLPANPNERDIGDALYWAGHYGSGIRALAFRYVQAEHSSVPRVRAALTAAGFSAQDVG